MQGALGNLHFTWIAAAASLLVVTKCYQYLSYDDNCEAVDVYTDDFGIAHIIYNCTKNLTTM
jgi:hypothetical protein